MAEELRFAATNVAGSVVADPGHWVKEQQPQAMVAMVARFVNGR